MDKQEYTAAQKLFMGQGFISAVPDLIDLPMEWIAQCKTDADAVRLVVNCRRDKTMTYESIADHIGMNSGNFSRALKFGSLTSARRMALMLVCGNRGLNQWENWKLGQVVVRADPVEQKIRELEIQLQELRATA